MFRNAILGLVAATVTLGAVAPAMADAAPRHRYYKRHDNRHYYGNRRCYDKGNGGLAIGGVAGGLLGNTVAGRGDKTLGTVIGAAAGALAGRAIDKSDGRPC